MSRAMKMRGSQGADQRESSSSSSSSAMQQQQQQQQQQSTVLKGSVAILWDMENCPVPSEVKADDVAGNIRTALRLHPAIQFGAVTFFSAYGDFNHFPRKVREGCQRTGVNLIDVPNGKKDASDKAILVDLFLFALDNAPPCTIFLISGDVDFAPALHKLGQRGYTVVMAIPSGVGVSSALCSAGRFVWDWPSVARGEGLVPAKNPSRKIRADERMVAETIDTNVSAGQQAGPAAWSPEDDSDLPSDDQVQDEEEQIVWRSPAVPRPAPVVVEVSAGLVLDGGAPQQQQQRVSVPSTAGKSPPVFPAAPPAAAGPREQSHPPSPGAAPPAAAGVGAREWIAAAAAGRAQGDSVVGSNFGAKGSSRNLPSSTPTESLQGLREDLVQGLREELVRLVSLNGSKMELSRVPAEYQKQYGKPMVVGGDYGHGGSSKLVNLLERWREWLFVRGEGATRMLQLTRNGSRVAARLRRDAKSGRGVAGGVPTEEAEVIDSASKFQEKDVADEDDETAGEEVVVGCPPKGIQALVEVQQPLLVVDEEPLIKSDEGDLSKETSSPVAAATLGRDAKNDRSVVPKEEDEEEMMASAKSQKKDVGEEVDDDDEIAGEEVIMGCATKGMQTFITEIQSILLANKIPQQKNEGGGGEHMSKEQDDISLPNYDRAMGSGGPGRPGDEADNSLQEEKDVQVDEGTLEQVKSKGSSRFPGWEKLLDEFRFQTSPQGLL